MKHLFANKQNKKNIRRITLIVVFIQMNLKSWKKYRINPNLNCMCRKRKRKKLSYFFYFTKNVTMVFHFLHIPTESKYLTPQISWWLASLYDKTEPTLSLSISPLANSSWFSCKPCEHNPPLLLQFRSDWPESMNRQRRQLETKGQSETL